MGADQPASCAPAGLQWDEQGQPISREFGDFYFSRVDGVEEARYVFLQHNQLPQRWSHLRSGSKFTIAETGFGTGLNFLTTWRAWREFSPPEARLHFVSVEKHPLSLDDLRRALALWPQLESLSQQLLNRYPPPCGGYHHLRFDQGRVTLTLMIGDAGECYESLDGRVDAWYLDGFSPAKNPEMWTPRLFAAIAACSDRQTSFSTFSAAAVVRKGLAQVGFEPQKVPGFGGKRDMLKGHYRGSHPVAQPWHRRPPPAASRAAVVIGAGIAGAASARALADRGFTVSVIDRGAGPASEASGNPQGVLYAKLPAKPTPQSQVHLQGYLHSLALLTTLEGSADYWSPCGVLQLPANDGERQRQQNLIDAGHYPRQLVSLLDQPGAESVAGVPLNSGALWFSGGGWVAPARLCAALLDHPRISCRYHTPVAELEQRPDGWRLLAADGGVIQQCTTLVVACAASSRAFSVLAQLPLKSIRGQISRAQAPAAPLLKTVLCGKGYVSPPHQQRYCFGATFTLDHQRPEVLDEDHRHNLQHLGELSHPLAAAISSSGATLAGRTGFRCATPDYLPLAGPVADHSAFVNTYAPLRHDAGRQISAPPPLLPGLYVNIGHGSKGLITAPLCGELLASMIDDTPLPLAKTLIPYLHPARFIIKDLKRRAI